MLKKLGIFIICICLIGQVVIDVVIQRPNERFSGYDRLKSAIESVSSSGQNMVEDISMSVIIVEVAGFVAKYPYNSYGFATLPSSYYLSSNNEFYEVVLVAFDKGFDNVIAELKIPTSYSIKNNSYQEYVDYVDKLNSTLNPLFSMLYIAPSINTGIAIIDILILAINVLFFIFGALQSIIPLIIYLLLDVISVAKDLILLPIRLFIPITF